MEAASQSLIVMSLGQIYGLPLKYEKTNDSADVWLNIIDEHYLPLHRHTLLAGKNFTPKQEGAAESETIVNERLLKRFNIANSDPAKAIGEEVTIDGKKLTIVGVVKDFHYETVEDNIEPMAFPLFCEYELRFRERKDHQSRFAGHTGAHRGGLAKSGQGSSPGRKIL